MVEPTDQFEPDAVKSADAGGEDISAAAEKLGVISMSLSKSGVHQGYLNRNDKDWAVLSDDPLQLEQYLYNGQTYYRVAADKTRYMSVGNAVGRKGYVGFYNWLGATSFQLSGQNLVSDSNGQKLSLYSQDDRYLYCWDDYSVLEVKFI
jgi:hypothetical protein